MREKDPQLDALEGRNRGLRNQLSITLMVLMLMVMMVVMVMLMVMMAVTFHREVMHNLHLTARPARCG